MLNPSTHCTLTAPGAATGVGAGRPGCPPAGGARPGHSPSACLAVCADAEVKQEKYAVETPSWPGDKLRDYDAGIRSTAPYVVPSHLPQLHFSV